MQQGQTIQGLILSAFRSLTFLTLKTDNFANFVIFAILDFSDFWVSYHFGFLLLFGTTLQILQNQH